MGVKSPQILPLIVVYPKTILHIPSIVFFNIFFLFLLISVPQCSNQITTESDDLCSINELFSCGENQICVQLEADQNMGECQCKQGFDKQDDGVRFLCEIVGTFFPGPGSWFKKWNEKLFFVKFQIKYFFSIATIYILMTTHLSFSAWMF